MYESLKTGACGVPKTTADGDVVGSSAYCFLEKFSKTQWVGEPVPNHSGDERLEGGGWLVFVLIRS